MESKENTQFTVKDWIVVALAAMVFFYILLN